MTKDELLASANALARNLDQPGLTERTLRDLVGEGLIEGPTPVGRRRGQHPDWQWSETSLEAARAIVELANDGVKRKHLLAVYLYFRGLPIPVERLRTGLKHEARRMMRTTRREFPDTALHDKTPDQREALYRRMGPLDPSLAIFDVEGFKELILGGMDQAVWGDEETIAHLRKMFGQTPDRPTDGDDDLAPFIATLLGTIGIFAEPDESASSALEVIDRANSADFEQARAAALLLLMGASALARIGKAFDFAQFGDLMALAVRTLVSPVWLTLLFTGILNGIITLRET